MVDGYIKGAGVLVVALLFGGMFLFSATFASFLFKHLSPKDARLLIRKAFPSFYLFVIFCSGLAALLFFPSDPRNAAWMVGVVITALMARQGLMPAINAATDAGLKTRFLWLHGFSVLLTLAHIVIAGLVLVRASH